MIIIQTAYFLCELIVGFETNSIALISDAYNMLSDLISVIIGLACLIVRLIKANLLSISIYHKFIFSKHIYLINEFHKLTSYQKKHGKKVCMVGREPK